MLIVTVIGARPQFVKAAVVSREFKKYPDLEEIIVHTGQHYDDNMSDIFFSELEIPHPQVNLEIGSAGHGAQTGRMLEHLEELLLSKKPDCVLVYGDTNSTLAGVLAASKLHIPIAHVEAGLRSFNRRMPEEINRVVADHLSDILFVPTELAEANLHAEGIDKDKIYPIGDVMFDAALLYAEMAKKKSDILQRLELSPKSYVLVTVHRPENTDNTENLNNLFKGLMEVASQVKVVCPLHPRTRSKLINLPLWQSINQCLQITEAVGYLDMLLLEENSLLIATDSGGVQKEAFFQKVPCVTLRTETEWKELVETGWNRVVPPSSPDTISQNIFEAMKSKGTAINLYGCGKAAIHLTACLLKHFSIPK